MSWISSEPIAPAAPILVHGEVQDGYLQQHGAEDRINIEVIASNEPRLPKKEPSSTNAAACVRQEADDRIDILEYELNNERQPGKAATPATLRAPDPVIEELEGDPRYQCLRAQIDSPHWSQNNCCQSCRNCITTSEHLWNDKLKRAYNSGLAMLMSSVFPVASNHTLRCFWVLCQLMFSIPFVVLSSLQLTGQESISNCNDFNITISTATANVNFSFALLFLVWACCDTLACFVIVFQKYISQQQNQQPHEAEPLLRYNWQTSCMSCYKNWLYKYSDILRLVVTEIFTYFILVSPTITSSLTGFCSYLTVNVVMLACSAATFLILVYITQLLFFVNFTIHLRSRMKPRTRSKAMWLLLRFFVHFVGYRICQTLLVFQVYYYGFTIAYISAVVGILTYFTPVVGILTFLILKHGWIYDLCIVYCTDYLSYLHTIQCNPNTGQETRQSIRADLSKFEFEVLMHESHKYKSSRSAVNFAYPLLSAKTILLSLPNAACLITLIICGAFSLEINDSLSLSTFGIILCLLVVNNIQLILVLLIYPIFLLGACIHSVLIQSL